jgi:imidazole glycerol-phosphate synthase subunit HisH
MIVIIDYKMGNLYSIQKAIEYLGEDVIVSNDHAEILKADKIILPGVGAFPDGMKNLRNLNLIYILKDQILSKRKPFLGICLGMQLLAKKSYEFQETTGLGFIESEVIKFPFQDPVLKVPHVGWDDIKVIQRSSLFNEINTGDCFYFVHSFYMKNERNEDVAATCDYGVEFTCAIKRANIFATQFHPEKSQENGLKILSAFINWDGE